MAFNQQITDRCKAEGFFRHVEWNRRWGILVRIYDKKHGESTQLISFESVKIDTEYDQQVPGYRQFFLSRRDTVQFLLNRGISPMNIASAFKNIDGMQIHCIHVR